MGNFETSGLTKDQKFGTDVLLDQYLKLLAGRKEEDIQDKETLLELARLKSVMPLVQSSLEKIDKELSWAGTRANEGVALVRESMQNAKKDDVRLGWEKPDPDANINAMMDHLESREQAKEREMNDLRVKINIIFRHITETRLSILEEILPKCKNENKQEIENSLMKLMQRIIQVNEDLERDSHSMSFNIEQAQAYAEEIEDLSNEMQALYRDNLDDLADLD